MKTLFKYISVKKPLFLAIFTLVAFLGIKNVAFAAVPNISIYSTGNNQVQVTVNNADPNYIVNLYYNYSGVSNVYVANIGTTNSSGYLSITLNQNSYSIPQNAYVYVTVNGQSSSAILWPNNNYSNTVLSQNNLNLNVGQGQAISISGTGSYSISSNSNPTAISSMISGNTLNVYGSAPGSGTLNVCSTSGGGCASIYVAVGGYVYDNNNTNNGNYNYNTYYNGRVLGSTVDASSVYLNQVPSTGISLNLKVVLFMIGLLTWSLFATYIFVAKKRRVVR